MVGRVGYLARINQLWYLVSWIPVVASEELKNFREYKLPIFWVVLRRLTGGLSLPDGTVERLGLEWSVRRTETEHHESAGNIP